MCSIVMPADYETIISASPPVFSHSPPRFFNQYSQLYRLHTPPPLQMAPSTSSLSCGPRRPCLIIRPSISGSSDIDEPTSPEPNSPTKLKKKVVFADDRGLALTQVRVMSEPSDCPPRWTSEFLAQVTKGASAEVIPDSWEVTFRQPASNYLEFRQRLETVCVSLENVIVKESEGIVVGTIKVKNMSYHKDVFVRISMDGWLSFQDTLCSFVESGLGAAAAYSLYDTFSFKLPLPVDAKSDRIEFCVCFRCDKSEFWDNNEQKNYAIVRAGSKQPTADLPLREQRSSLGSSSIKVADAVNCKLDSWSEFASWSHLSNDTPYW